MNAQTIHATAARAAELQNLLDDATCPIKIREYRAELDRARALLRSVDYQESNGITTFTIPLATIEHPMEKSLVHDFV